MRKIVAAFDSFKGSLSSAELAAIAADSVHKVFPDCQVEQLSIGDGGEGTMSALLSRIKGKKMPCSAHDPLTNPITVEYCCLSNKKVFIEAASVIGLSLVPIDKRNPLLTTTYGLGEIIKDALLRGYREFIIGLRGSATNDAGTGMLQALGFRFFNREGKELGVGGQILEHIIVVDHSQVLPELAEATFTLASDVINPLSGINGAACVFAVQKGADEEMIRVLDKGLKNFARVVKYQYGKDVDSISGAGAAGGLGGGFLAFTNATVQSGIEVVLKIIKFNEIIQGADLIITGEGRIDRQTLMGKSLSGILNAAMEKKVPVIALAGSINDQDILTDKGFLAILPILPYPVNLVQAMDKGFTSSNIKFALEQQLRVIKYFRHGTGLLIPIAVHICD